MSIAGVRSYVTRIVGFVHPTILFVPPGILVINGFGRWCAVSAEQTAEEPPRKQFVAKLTEGVVRGFDELSRGVSCASDADRRKRVHR